MGKTAKKAAPKATKAAKPAAKLSKKAQGKAKAVTTKALSQQAKKTEYAHLTRAQLIEALLAATPAPVPDVTSVDSDDDPASVDAESSGSSVAPPPPKRHAGCAPR